MARTATEEDLIAALKFAREYIRGETVEHTIVFVKGKPISESYSLGRFLDDVIDDKINGRCKRTLTELQTWSPLR